MSYSSIAVLAMNKANSIAAKRLKKINSDMLNIAKDWRRLVRSILTSRTKSEPHLVRQNGAGRYIAMPRMQTGDLKAHFRTRVSMHKGSSLKRTPAQVKAGTHLNIAEFKISTTWSANPHGVSPPINYGLILNNNEEKYSRYNGWRDHMQELLNKRIRDNTPKGTR